MASAEIGSKRSHSELSPIFEDTVEVKLWVGDLCFDDCLMDGTDFAWERNQKYCHTFFCYA